MQRENKPKNFLPKATYKGGSKAMSKFIGEHLKYPKQAIKNKISGTVVLRVAIDYKGKVTGSKVKSSVGHGCDEEAQRVVSLLKFEVGSKVRKGKILFHKNLNIHFRLPKPKAEPIKKAESSKTQLSYTVVSSKPKSKPKLKPASYNYTINLN